MKYSTTPEKFRFGWRGPDEAKRAWETMQDRFQSFLIAGKSESSAGKRMVAWDFARKINDGNDLPNRAQQIGSCVGHGAANVVNYLACIEIVRAGEPEIYREAHVPYIYGISRVQIGGGQLERSDGSLGSWAADGVRQFGILASDEPGVPLDSGATAKQWGMKPGPPLEWIGKAKQHLIGTTARIRSYEALRDALANGYPCTIASMRGFSMTLRYDKSTRRHWWTGRDQWPHQMSVTGVDDDPQRPGAFRDNSWGPDSHGPQEDGPMGGGWQDADDIDRELRDDGTECFAFSQFDGFPEQFPDNYFA